MSTNSIIKVISGNGNVTHISSNYDGYFEGMSSKLYEAFNHTFVCSSGLGFNNNIIHSYRSVPLVNALICGTPHDMLVIPNEDVKNYPWEYFYTIDVREGTIHYRVDTYSHKRAGSISIEDFIETYSKKKVCKFEYSFLNEELAKKVHNTISNSVANLLRVSDKSNPNFNNYVEKLKTIEDFLLTV